MMMGQSEADHYQSLAVIREEGSAEGLRQPSSLNDSTAGLIGFGNNEEANRKQKMTATKYQQRVDADI